MYPFQAKIKSLSLSSIVYSNLWLRILDYKCPFNKKTTRFRKQISHKTSWNIIQRNEDKIVYIKYIMISLIGIYEPILQSIYRRKLKLYGHKIRHYNLSKTILQGMVEGNIKYGRPKRTWIDDIKEWNKMTQSDLMVKPHDSDVIV